jgi:hypothetical protein
VGIPFTASLLNSFCPLDWSPHDDWSLTRPTCCRLSFGPPSSLPLCSYWNTLMASFAIFSRALLTTRPESSYGILCHIQPSSSNYSARILLWLPHWHCQPSTVQLLVSPLGSMEHDDSRYLSYVASLCYIQKECSPFYKGGSNDRTNALGEDRSVTHSIFSSSWLKLSQDRFQWRALANMVVKLQVL